MTRVEKVPELRKKFVAMVESGATCRELTKAFGVCEETIYNWKYILGLPILARNMSPIDNDKVLRERFTAMVKSGASYAKLAKEFGISEATIPAWKKKLGLPLDLNVGHRHSRYYTVYLKKNGAVVCSGYAEDCMRELKMSRATFYSMVSRAKSGKHGKYEVLAETVLPGIEEECN